MTPPRTPRRLGELQMMRVGMQNLRVASRRGSGRPLLLFNGMGIPLEQLAPFVRHLDEDRPLVGFDAPGSGGSPVTWWPFFPWSMARWADAILDELGFDEVDVLGSSWGGLIAQQFALQYPGRVAKVVLVSTGVMAAPLPGGISFIRPATSPHLALDPAHSWRLMLDLMPVPVGETEEPVFLDLPSADGGAVASHNAIGMMGQLMAVAGWNSSPWLPRLAAPTLILAGLHDRLSPPSNARLLERLIPDARRIELDAGHMLLSTLPERCASEVERFLDAPAAVPDSAPASPKRPRIRRTSLAQDQA